MLIRAIKWYIICFRILFERWSKQSKCQTDNLPVCNVKSIAVFMFLPICPIFVELQRHIATHSKPLNGHIKTIWPLSWFKKSRGNCFSFSNETKYQSCFCTYFTNWTPRVSCLNYNTARHCIISLFDPTKRSKLNFQQQLKTPIQ